MNPTSTLPTFNELYKAGFLNLDFKFVQAESKSA
jgi:hypothetical protein